MPPKKTYTKPIQRIKQLEKKKKLYEQIDRELVHGINLYRFIVENSHIGIFVIDNHFKVVYANNELVNIIGYTLDEIVGSDFRDYLSDENKDVIADRYVRRQKGEALENRYEVEFYRKDGTQKTVEISVAVTQSIADHVLTVVQIFDISERKRIEAELEKSNKKYHDLFQNVFDFIFIHDLDGNFLETNVRYVTEMGGVPEEIAGANLKDLIPERFRPDFNDYLKRILRKEKDEGLIAIQVPSGEERILEYKNALIYDDDNRPSGVWGSARDITEQLRAKKALKASEEKYRTMIQNIEDCYFEVSLTGDLLFCNDALVKQSGYSREEIIGMNYEQCTSPDDITRVYEMFNKVHRTGEIGKELNYKLVRKDGSSVYIETTCTLMKDDMDNPVGFRGISRDITERKRAEKILIEKEQSLREIIEGSPIPTFVINSSHHITHWNEACEKLTSIRSTDIIGTNHHWKPFYPEKQPLLADLVLDRAHRKNITKYYGKKCKISGIVKGAYEGEFFFPGLGKKGTWLSITAAPLKDSKGRITGAIETLRDISEKKRAERNLLKWHDALEEKVQERTRNLQETNIALEVLLKKREGDRRDVEEQMLYNIREVITPYIERLKNSPLKERQKIYLEIIERNLKEIAAPFMRGLSDTFHKLTPTEIQVINLIKQEKTSKEIADFLSVSPRTIEFHRDNIRKKLGIKNRKINLRTYLLSLR